jgi:SLOG family YspA-like protein
MRVLVCSGRDYNDRETVFHELHKLAETHGWLTIINGGARGADQLARDFATSCYHGVVTMPADWTQFGKVAGVIRNEQMLISGRSDLVLAFPDGSGTADMVRRARKAGIAVIEISA